jgi:hypothetical protein
MTSARMTFFAASVVVLLSGCGGSGDGTPTVEVPAGPTLTISSGNNQLGVIGEVLPQPVLVTLRASDGIAMPNETLSFAPDEDVSESVQTDSNGQSSSSPRTGPCTNRPYSPPTRSLPTSDQAWRRYVQLSGCRRWHALKCSIAASRLPARQK